MFAQSFRRLPASFKSLAVATGIVLVATFSTAGASLATTDPIVEIPDATPYSERCQRAVSTFHREIEWILDFMDANPGFDPNDPELSFHRDKMWTAWGIAEYECGIDVGGDGEIG